MMLYDVLVSLPIFQALEAFRLVAMTFFPRAHSTSRFHKANGGVEYATHLLGCLEQASLEQVLNLIN